MLTLNIVNAKPMFFTTNILTFNKFFDAFTFLLQKLYAPKNLLKCFKTTQQTKTNLKIPHPL
jgi:hypothetical protein